MIPEKRPFQPPTSSDVCAIYELLYSNGLVSFPITEEAAHKIEAIVANINNTYFDVVRYATAEEKAAAYLFFLIKGHPFTDGNKRTAVLFFSVFCSFNDLVPDQSKFSLDELAVYIEQLKEEKPEQSVRVIAAVLFGWDFMERNKKL
jgi:death-on-curing family protein